MSLLDFPKITLSPTLDHSWQGVLAFASERGMQFGTDIVFTYGPLGFLANDLHSGWGLGMRVVWEMLFKISLAIAIYFVSSRLLIPNRIFFFVSIILFSSFPEWHRADVLYLLLMTWVVLLSANDESSGSKFLYSAPVFLAGLCLIKFTFLLFACINILSLFVWSVARKRWYLCVYLVGGFTSAFLVGWCLTGQSILNLPEYIIHSREISHGFHYAMGIDCSQTIVFMALGAGILVVLTLIALGLSLPNKVEISGLFLTIAAGIFWAWKEGFIRADIHIANAFTYIWLLTASLPAFYSALPRFQRLVQWLSLPVASLSLAGLHILNPAYPVENFPDTLARIASNSKTLLHFPGYFKRMDKLIEKSKADCHFPEMTAAVGNGTVDVFGFVQAIALLNEWNYTPRPVIQSYSAYTDKLMQLNEDFYLSEKAPDFVVFHFTPIDGHYPSVEDGLVFYLLLKNYRVRLIENGLLLLEKKPTSKAETPILLREAKIAFKETVPVPSGLVWLQLDLEETLTGKMRTFLYKPSSIVITVLEKGGQEYSYKLIASTASAGFLLNPLIRDANDWLNLLDIDVRREIVAFRLDTYPEGFMANSITVRMLAP